MNGRFLWIALVIVGVLLLAFFAFRTRVGTLRTESESVEMGDDESVRRNPIWRW